jgi:hypothetical protein
MYKLLLVFYLSILVSVGAMANDTLKKTIAKPAPVPKVLQLDSSKIAIRSFDSVAMNQYRKDPIFSYHEEDEHQLSWWSRFWRWVWHVLQNLFGSRDDTPTERLSPIFKIILLVVAVGALIYVVIKVMGVNLANIFGRESKEINLPYNESLENIHEITFEEEIEKALSQRNYRLAVRLLYLNSLKQLNDAQLIQWQIDKTNSTYLNELTDSDKRQSFTVLTRQFEFVWYGDFPIDGRSYQNISTLFQDFKKLLA